MSEELLYKFLMLSGILFVIGLLGMFNKKNSVINIYICIELMMLAININFVSFSVYLQDIAGQVFAMMSLAIAAAELAIGLAILVIYHRHQGDIAISNIKIMQNVE